MKPPIEQLTEKPEPGVIDAFIEDWKPEAETYEIETPSGARIVFRAAKDRGELKAIQRAAELQSESSGKPFPDPDKRELYAQDKQTIALASVMAQLVVSPKLRMEDFLRLAKKAPLGFEYVVDGLNRAQSAITTKMEARLLTEAKNASSGTPTGAPASELPATGGTGTRTSSKGSRSRNT